MSRQAHAIECVYMYGIISRYGWMWSVLPEQQCVAIVRGWRLLFHRHPGGRFLLFALARESGLLLLGSREIRNWLFSDMSCAAAFLWVGYCCLEVLSHSTASTMPPVGQEASFDTFRKKANTEHIRTRSAKLLVRPCTLTEQNKALEEKISLRRSAEVKLAGRYFWMQNKYHIVARGWGK